GLVGIVAIGLLAAACGGTGVASSGPSAVPTVAVPPAPTGRPTEVPPAQVTGSLSVLDWPGYDTADFWADFKNTYKNVTVSFEFGSTDAEIYGHMKGGSQADVFHPYTGWLQFYVDE